MIRCLILILLISVHLTPAFSQDWASIKNNSAYLYGEGWGTTLNEADKEAIKDLISKISVSVTTSSDLEEHVRTHNGQLKENASFKMAIHTYSNATLNNSERCILASESQVHVGRWIKRSEVAKLFDARKQKALEYVETAQKALENRKIDVALKDFYWAWALVQSLQYPTDVAFVDENNESRVLVTWLPNKIDEVLDDLEVQILDKKETTVELLFYYRDEVVSSIDYTFFDGSSWSNLYSAKDGIGVLELAPGYTTDKYSLRIEYAYRGESHIDKDVADVLKVKSEDLRKSSSLIARKHVEKVPQSEVCSIEEIEAETLLEATEATAYQRTLEQVVSSIVTKQDQSVKSLFTAEAYPIYEALFKYGRSQVVGKPDLRFYVSGDKVVARGLQMSFSFKKGFRKTFTENLVFTFNKEGLVENVAFGLDQVAERDIFEKGVWPMDVRMAVVQFLENYQTAYALGRLDYISTIFDDDAVIITGRVVHRMERNSSCIDGLEWNDSKIVTYNRYDKDSFLKQLKRSFDSKEYVNLRLADNDIRKLGIPGEVYSIQIAQEYYSSNYGDKGYLFLMVDMNNSEKPIIKVRTWQPEPDPEFGKYGPEDFQ